MEALAGKANVLTRAAALIIETDFYNTTSPFAQGLTGAAVSAGTITAIDSSVNHPGVVAFRDSTTAGGGYRADAAVAAFHIAGGEKFVCTFQARTALTSMLASLGFRDNSTATEPLDGVFLRLVGDGTSNVTVSGRARSNNAQTVTASSHTLPINTWVTAIITVAEGGASALFELFAENGTLLWSGTVASNLPTGAGRFTSVGVIATESTTSAAVDLIWLDYLRVEVTRALVR